jgi:hypothetical protein
MRQKKRLKRKVEDNKKKANSSYSFISQGKMSMSDNQITEIISDMGKPLTYIIRHEIIPESTTFLTPPEFTQQVGFVVYRSGGEVKRHMHLPLERHLIGTSEVLIVRQGHCLMDIYNDHRKLVATRELRTGDIMLMVGGGHGFRMLEDTTFLEVKQGPFLPVTEKEHF